MKCVAVEFLEVRFRAALYVGLVLPLAGSLASGQTSLIMASGTASRGTSTSLNLSLANSGTPSAAVGWTLSYPPADVAAVSVGTGPAASAAGKKVECVS